MSLRRNLLIAAASTMVAAPSEGFASTASENRAFNAVVARVVAGFDNPNLEEMTRAERREWNTCVQRIFAGIPQGRKRYVLEASNRSEQESRLEKISLEDRAAVRQQITSDCPI